MDLILGGKGNTFWYVVTKKGKVTESYIGKYAGGVWEDVYVKGSGATQKTKAVPAGSTIRKIAEKAYLCQDETWVTRRTPKPIEDSHPRYHYVYGFGDKDRMHIGFSIGSTFVSPLILINETGLPQ